MSLTHTPGDVRITALDAMEHAASRTLVRVETDAGITGYGEAGADGPTVRAQLGLLEDDLVGENPLEIERHFDRMTTRQHSYRPHVATVSGVDTALWDVAGKVFDRPVSELLQGRFREAVPFYVNTGPDDPLDPESCHAWAERVLDGSDRPSAVKLTFDGVIEDATPDRVGESGRDKATLTNRELDAVGRAAENVRAALGDDLDFVAHCHSEWDLPSALGLAEAVAPAEPLWLEDPLPIEYTEGWRTLKRDAPCRILTGEKLELAREFQPFLANGAVDAVQPDLAFAGGITGVRKIADLAALHYVPLTAHDTGGLVLNAATVHLGASVRNFWIAETKLPQDDLIRAMGDAPGLDVVDGALGVPEGPGLGVDLDEGVLREHRVEGEPYWD